MLNLLKIRFNSLCLARLSNTAAGLIVAGNSHPVSPYFALLALHPPPLDVLDLFDLSSTVSGFWTLLISFLSLAFKALFVSIKRVFGSLCLW